MENLIDEKALYDSDPYTEVMTEYTEEEQRILAYLTDSVTRGEQYVRSRTIADAINLTAKQVGSRLPRLAEKSDEVEIEKWGRARSTTWRVTRGKPQ